jgi:hypothetical protein
MAEPLPLLGSGAAAAAAHTAGGHPADADPQPASLPLPPPAPELRPEPVLCHHCGRTASNGVSCEGMCVADSGY